MEMKPDMPRFILHVDALDAADRDRQAHIGTRGRRVVVIPPPGEGFSLTKKGARQMAAFLREAAYQADDDPDDVPDPDVVTTTTTAASNFRRPGDAPSHPEGTPRPPVANPHGEHDR